MQQKEEIEVKYIKQNTAIILAVICLIVGFIAGTIYSLYKAPVVAGGSASGVVYGGSKADSATLLKQQEIVALEKEVAENPDNQNAWLLLGNLYFDTHRYTQAIKAYNAYLERNPNNANVWTDLGVMYRRNKRPQDAIRAFDEAVKNDPRHETARFNKGIVLMHDLKKTSEAKAVWEELYRLNPSYMGPNGRPLKEMIGKQ
jgi:cytochrome c-type biogenesis protein CcmH/NrfG